MTFKELKVGDRFNCHIWSDYIIIKSTTLTTKEKSIFNAIILRSSTYDYSNYLLNDLVVNIKDFDPVDLK